MTIKIASKNIDLGEALREHAAEKIQQILEKYDGQPISGHISVEKAASGFSTLCAIHLSSGIDLQANGEAADAYASVDTAIERLEKRLRRYKRRLKNHHRQHQAELQVVNADGGISYVLQADGEDETETGDNTPVIVAEMPAKIRQMSVSDAVMQMDLADELVLVFRNASHGGVNVVYRRTDGNIGWIDPSGIVSQQ